MNRRRFLGLLAYGGAATLAPWTFGCQSAAPAANEEEALAAGSSPYGRWVNRFGAPAFVYDADQDALPGAIWDPIAGPLTRRHWLMVGNRAIRMQIANDGTVALFYEGYGLRWLLAPEPAGSGVSIVEDGDKRWSTYYEERPTPAPSSRTFGPTWFEVRDQNDGLSVERLLLCPEGAGPAGGDAPWLLVRVKLALAQTARGSRAVRHTERWTLRPRFLGLAQTPQQAKERAELAVSYDVSASPRGLLAREVFASPDAPGAVGEAARTLFGPAAAMVLERLGDTQGNAHYANLDGSPHPTLDIVTELTLAPGEARELWFRFGLQDGTAVSDPEARLAASMTVLAARLPRAEVPGVPEAAHEIPWHAAMLTGGLAIDRIIGEHTLNPGSAYAYVGGINGAARDALQHALPLVYFAPETALSVLRNTCAWAQPNGDLPYALDPAKHPTNLFWRPSDQNLWALWLATEYAAVTGDLKAFDAPLAYHPDRAAPAVPLREHLRRQFRFFIDVVGRGARNHVRILNADWNDAVLREPGIDPSAMAQRGSSVLDSAMASWVLRAFATLADRLEEGALAGEARAQSEDLRRLVSSADNGRWYQRAYSPDGKILGDTDSWLEVQPWAILCGAADDGRAGALLDFIEQSHCAGSPLGARVRWPARTGVPPWGESTSGGIWPSIGMTLIWAAARVRPRFAWDQWRRMSLQTHTATYPDIWEGTLSGPDAWNAPESSRPGRTWADASLLAMQAFPVNNMHIHSQPLFALLRLLGQNAAGATASFGASRKGWSLP